MNIKMNLSSKYSVNAFLVITKEDHSLEESTSYRYEVSPTGIHVISREDSEDDENPYSEKLSPMQLIIREASSCARYPIDSKTTYLHGVITPKDPSGQQLNPVAKFSFEFISQMESEQKIPLQLKYLPRRDPITNTYEPDALILLLQWEIDRYNRRLKSIKSGSTLLPPSLLQLGILENKELSFLIEENALQEIAHRLHSSLRCTDMIAKWNHGFLILLPETSKKDALRLSKQVQQTLEHPGILLNENSHMEAKVAIGISTYKQHTDITTILTQLEEHFNEEKNRLYTIKA